MAQDGSPPRGREAFHLPKVITRTTRLHEDRTLPELVGWEGLLGQNAIRDRNAQNSRRRSKSDHERKRELRLPEVSPESSREDVGRYGPVRSARTPPLVSVARADVSRAEVSGRKQVEIVSGVIGREENVRPSSRGVVFLKPLNVRENVEADEDWLSSPHLVATPRQLTKLPLQEWRERVAVSSGGVVSSRSEGDIVLTHSVSSSLSNLSPRSMAKVRGSSDYNRGNGTAEKGKSGGDLSGDLQTGGQMAETTGVMISSRPGGQATEESAGALSSMEASWKKEEEYFAVGAAQLSLGNSGPVPGFAEAKEGGVEIDLERGTADPLETAEGFELPPGKRKAVWAPEMLSTIPRVKVSTTLCPGKVV